MVVSLDKFFGCRWRGTDRVNKRERVRAARLRCAPDERLTNLSAELLKISPETPDPAAIRYAAEFIRRGELVAIPTDTFYGIAADPFNLAAVDQIYRVKGRPETRALPILVNTIAQAISLARDVPYSFHKLAAKFWPGPLTLLVEASTGRPPENHRQYGKRGAALAEFPNCKCAHRSRKRTDHRHERKYFRSTRVCYRR